MHRAATWRSNATGRYYNYSALLSRTVVRSCQSLRDELLGTLPGQQVHQQVLETVAHPAAIGDGTGCARDPRTFGFQTDEQSGRAQRNAPRQGQPIVLGDPGEGLRAIELLRLEDVEGSEGIERVEPRQADIFFPVVEPRSGPFSEPCRRARAAPQSREIPTSHHDLARRRV